MHKGDLILSNRFFNNDSKTNIRKTSNKETQKWGFEMQNGVASIFREKKKNLISTKKYTIYNFLPKIILRFFWRIGNLMFLLLSIMTLSSTDFTPFQIWLPITFVTIMLVLYITFELNLEIIRNNFDNRINNQKTTKGGKRLNDNLEPNVFWKDLDVGDIVYLQKEDVCPADIIILDTSEIYEREAICYVDMSDLDGGINFTKKKASILSQIVNRLPSKNNYKEFRKGLSGKIEYQRPSSNINEFSGYFRLKKDPKVEGLTIENFIPRGATLKNAEWVFGLIVFSGFDTKIMQNSNYQRHKINYIEYLTQIYFIFSGFVLIFFAMIHTIVVIAVVKKNNLDLIPLFLKADPIIGDTSRFFIYIVLYSPLLPLFLYGFLDLVSFLQKFLIEYRINQEFNGEICIIPDPIPFVNIAQAKYALFDKTGTLTTSNYRISQIFFNNKLYKMRIDPKLILETLSEQEKIKYFSSPFNNTKFQGNTLFANNLLNSTLVNNLSTIIDPNNKAMKINLSKIEESHFDQEENTVYSEYQINEIKGDNVFSFKRNFESIDQDNQYSENYDIQHQKRNSIEIVKRLLGKNNASPATIPNKFEIQISEVNRSQDNLSSNRILMNNNKDFLNVSIVNNNNDNSQLSFRKEDNLKLEEISLIKKNLLNLSPGSFNKLPETNPYYYLHFNERDFLQDLLKTDSNHNLDSLFEGLTLCHGARIQSKTNKIICGRREDEVILDFSKKCSFVFDKTDNPENPTQYFFKYKTQKLVYNIFGINDFYNDKKSLSVVYKTPIKEELYLVCKGEEGYMRGILLMNKKEQEIYDYIVKDMKNQGLKPIIYARKPLSVYQTQDYNNKMRNLKTSLINQTAELDQLGKSLENNLELLSIVGLKDEFTEGVDQTIDFLKDIDVNIWMVTGDCKENALSSAYATRICNPITQKPKEIIQEDESSLNLIIRNHLIEIKNIYNAIKTKMQNYNDNINDKDRFGSKLFRQMSAYLYRLRKERNAPSLQTQNQKIFAELKKRMENFYFIINGKSLEIIMRDSFLKAHMVFLLSLVKNIVAYNVSPQMKESLVSIVQNDFVGSPSVLAIGDSYNDVLMLQKADIGIELIKKGNIEKRVNAGDIQISSLKMLRSLMLNEGLFRINLQENLVFFLFYQSFLIGFTIFLFFWFCILPLYHLYYSLMLFFYFFMFSSPSLLIYGLFGQSMKEKIVNIFPALCFEGLLKKRFIGRRFILKALLEAFFHGILIFYICFYSLLDLVNSDGLGPGLNSTVLISMIILILVNNLKILIKCLTDKVRFVILTLPIGIIFLVLFILIAVNLETSWSNWKVDIIFIFSNISGIMIIVGTTILCLLFSYIMDHYVYKNFVPSLYDTFASVEKVGNWKEITNEKILKYFEISNDIGNYVKEIFYNVESLDPTIQEMFTPADINVNEIELNKYTLAIQQPTIENKYNFLTKKNHSQRASIFLLLLISLYGIFTITILIIRNKQIYGFISLGIFLSMLILWFATLTNFYKKSYYGYTQFIILISVLAKLSLDWVGNPVYVSLGAVLVPHITTTNLNLGVIYVLGLNITYFISYFVILLCIYYNKYPYDFLADDFDLKILYELTNKLVVFYSTWNYIIYISCINLFCFYGLYKFEKLKRSEFLAKSRIENEANNVQDILAILVPKFVKDRLTNGDMTMQEAQDDVGIIFCDICDFDKIINSEGTKIVEILDEIFRNFDHLCMKHGVQKIETVGKTYMACAGLSSCEINFPSSILLTEKTKRLVNMALEMVKYIENITYGKGEHIKLKIGIHNGRIISGVIGYHKPQFSLIGDTVNTTSRVCSTGIDGSITMSEEAFENIKNSNISCEKRVVEAKGKGDLITYQVLNQKKIMKKKESKLKKLITAHMPKLREIYEKLKAESKKNQNEPGRDKNHSARYNKAVNLMSSWLVHKKIEIIEEEHEKVQNNEVPKILKNEPSNGIASVIEMIDSPLNSEEDKCKEGLRLKNSIFLTFEQDQSALTQDFLYSLFQKNKQESHISLLILLPIYLVNTLMMIMIQREIQHPEFILGFRSGYMVCLSLYLFLFLYDMRKSQWTKLLFMISYFYGIISSLLFMNFTDYLLIQQVGLLEMILIYLIFVNSNFLRFFEVLLITLLTFILWVIMYAQNNLIDEKNFFFIFTTLLYNLFKINYQIKYHIQSFNTILVNEAKKEEQNNLVSQLLPLHAFEKLKHVSVTNKIQLTDHFENVTILFADIAGFTKYSSSVKPEDVVIMLRKLFTEFDKLCLKHKVYKVYTIGDCYVVLGFLNANYRNPLEEAKNVVRMGLTMIDIIRNVRQLVNFPLLDMRIGVHTGDIIGGIIGTDIVRYDIYGKDVLIANKMESNGAEGNIMVSESTKKLLEKEEMSNFRFEWRKAVECKVQSEPINGYLLFPKIKE